MAGGGGGSTNNLGLAVVMAVERLDKMEDNTVRIITEEGIANFGWRLWRFWLWWFRFELYDPLERQRGGGWYGGGTSAAHSGGVAAPPILVVF